MIPDGYVPSPYPKHCYTKNPSDGSVSSKVFASPEDLQADLDAGVKWFESPGEATRGKADPVKVSDAPAVDTEKQALQAQVDALKAQLAKADANQANQAKPSNNLK